MGNGVLSLPVKCLKVNLQRKVYSMTRSSNREINVIFLKGCGFSKKGLNKFYIQYTDIIESYKISRNRKPKL